MAITTIPPSTKIPTHEWSSLEAADRGGQRRPRRRVGVDRRHQLDDRDHGAERAPDDVAEQRSPFRPPLRLRTARAPDEGAGDRRLLDRGCSAAMKSEGRRAGGRRLHRRLARALTWARRPADIGAVHTGGRKGVGCVSTHSQTKSGNGRGADRPVRRPDRHEHRSRLGVPSRTASAPRELKNGSVGTKELKGRSVTFGKIAAGAITSGLVQKRLADDGRLQPASAADRPDRRRRPGRPDRSRRTARPARPDRRAPGPKGEKGEPGALLGAIRCRPRTSSCKTPRGRERRAPTSARCAPAASVRSAPARAGLPPARPTCSTPSSCGRSSTGAESSWATRRAAPTARAAQRTFTLYVLCYRR